MGRRDALSFAERYAAAALASSLGAGVATRAWDRRKARRKTLAEMDAGGGTFSHPRKKKVERG